MRPQKYTFEQRKEWCEAYLKGEHVPTPLGARRATFIRELRDWARKYKRFGPDSIDPSAKRKDYSVAVILAAASLVASGEMSTKEAARQFNVKDKRTVRAWSRRYREGGEEALKSMRRRKPDAEKCTEAELRSRIAELERRLRQSELEVAYLKNLKALVDARESSQGTMRKPKP